MILATTLGVFLGVIAAVKKDTWWTLLHFASVLGIFRAIFFYGNRDCLSVRFCMSHYTGLI